MARYRNVVAFRHVADAHEFANAADALQVWHQDIGGAQFQHAAETVTGVFGLAAGDGRVERRGYSRKTLEIPCRQRLLKPCQVELLEHAAKPDRLDRKSVV